MFEKKMIRLKTEKTNIKKFLFELIHLMSQTKVRFLMCFTTLLLLAIWCGAYVTVNADQQLLLRKGILNLQNLTKSFKAHTEQTIYTSDQVLRIIKYQREKRSDLKYKELKDYFDRGVIDTRFINQIGIIDPLGDYVFSNLTNPPRVNLADREHFKIHKEPYPYGVFVSKSLIGRASKKLSIQLTRRIEDAQGNFAGVTVVSFNPNYLTDFYKSIDLGEKGVVALVGLDHTARVIQIGNQVVNTQEGGVVDFPSEVKDNMEGTFTSNRLFDGVNRVYAFERISNQPLVTIVGQPVDLLSEDSNWHKIIFYSIALLITLITLGFLITNVEYLNRLAGLNLDLIKSNHEVKQANKHKSEFLSSISHELRTPLNGIIGYAEYIHYTSKEPMIQFPAQIIDESSRHLLKLVNMLLDLTQVESGRMVLQNEIFNMTQVIEDVIQTHRSRTFSKNLKLTFENDEHCPDLVCMDELNLRRILNNLLDNAIKFSKQDGEITLSIHYLRDIDSIYFAIKDNGHGIPEDMHAHVFEKFWQNEEFITRVHGGSGMGLALTQKLVTLMGGEIKFNSSQNVGSTFYFTIPIKKLD
jgi:signal transduction histidine kinase